MPRRYAVKGLVSRKSVPRRTAKKLLFNVAAVMRTEGVEPIRRKGRLIDPRTGETVVSIEDGPTKYGKQRRYWQAQ